MSTSNVQKCLVEK